MRSVAVALPLSIVGVLILSSAAWACGDRPGDMCGRDERGPPGFKGDRPGRDRGEWEGLVRERIERARAEREDFESKRREIEDWAEKEARRSEAKMHEAIALQRNAETLQEYLSIKIAEEKNLTDAAIKREHEAADKIKEIEDSKKRYDEQINLVKADRDRYEKRFIEILAHDPCGQTPSAPGAGGAGTH
jgi:hypothetical protein